MKYDDEDSFIDDEYSDEEKSLFDSDNSSSSESEAPKPVSEDEESVGEGPSRGRRSSRLRNRDRLVHLLFSLCLDCLFFVLSFDISLYRIRHKTVKMFCGKILKVFP